VKRSESSEPRKNEEKKDKIIEEIFREEGENKTTENVNNSNNNQEEKVNNSGKDVETKTDEGKDETYNKMKVDELKAELKKRNVAFNNKDRKQDLINLLKQNDQAK
jgi:hypothetical protein